MIKLVCYSVAGVLTISLVALNVIVSGYLSTTGHQLRKIEQQKQELLVQSQALESEILSKTSLLQLQEKATELGYVQPKAVISIELPSQTVALNR